MNLALAAWLSLAVLSAAPSPPQTNPSENARGAEAEDAQEPQAPATDAASEGSAGAQGASSPQGSEPAAASSAQTPATGAAAPAPQRRAAAVPFDPQLRRPEVEAIVRRALTEPQAFGMLQRLCADAPKRLAGSAGAERALIWAQREMALAGLSNVRVEPCAVPHWEAGPQAVLELVDESGVPAGTLAACPLGGSIATPESGLVAEVIEVKGRAELDALGESAKGKFVFFNQPMDPARLDTFEAYGDAVWQRGRGAIEAARAGGVGALVRSMTTRLDDLPHTGAMRYEDGVERVPAAALSTLAAERLSKLLSEGRPVRVRLVLGCRWLEDASGGNVVGELVGSEKPEEILLVGGHLDAWETGDGAHDDGAGCVQAIEAARLLAASGLHPRRTVRVVLFANEENGLAGGRAYREAHALELPRHVLALESDRGGFTPRGFGTSASAEARPLLQSMVSLLAPLGAGRLEVGEGGADISVLARDGVPLFEYIPDGQRYFDVHHCARDTIESVSPRELELGAAAIASLLHLISEEPTMLPRTERPSGSR